MKPARCPRPTVPMSSGLPGFRFLPALVLLDVRWSRPSALSSPHLGDLLPAGWFDSRCAGRRWFDGTVPVIFHGRLQEMTQPLRRMHLSISWGIAIWVAIYATSLTASLSYRDRPCTQG